MHLYCLDSGWSRFTFTPSDDVVEEVVGLRHEDGKYESVVKVQAFDEHPREHRRVGVLHAADQHMADSRLQIAEHTQITSAAEKQNFSGGKHLKSTTSYHYTKVGTVPFPWYCAIFVAK